MQQWLNSLAEHLSVWTTVRAAGFTSYLLLFLAVTAGLLQGEPWVKGQRRVQLNLIHQWTGWFGLLFGLVHGLVLTYDQNVGYSLFELAIPFASHHEPLWTGLGTLSFYMLLLILISSDMIRTIGKKLWRAIHFLALPMFVMALLHGIMLGSDTREPGIQVMYMLTGLTIAGLVVRRIYVGRQIQAKRLVSVARRLS
ncbi:ferric reductase-like transmembrane domain-containing protein [Paenibacillus sp. sgz5001063]|uniref:ferric reductase-like transmembrane domain-containing protein n=1 Tax=Paenibacillus sp. sgz5001063 TaxID=3242474 RepID=UPI0036D3445B